MAVSDSEIGIVPITVCVTVARQGLTRVSRNLPPGGSGVCQAGWLVCSRDRLCITAYTRLSGPRGTLGTLPGQAGRPRGFGRAGWAGSEVKRAESPSSPPSPTRQTNKWKKMFTPGGRPGGRPAAGDFSIAQKQVSSGISSSLAGSGFGWQEVGFSISAPAGGRRAVITGVKQSYREEGPNTPYLIELEGTAHPSC